MDSPSFMKKEPTTITISATVCASLMIGAASFWYYEHKALATEVEIVNGKVIELQVVLPSIDKRLSSIETKIDKLIEK